MTNVPLSNLRATWATSNTTVNTAIYMNANDVSSAANSRLLVLAVDHVEKFIVYKDGTLEANGSPITGTQGTQGVQGPSPGPQGATGTQGVTGPQGTTGTTGTQGTIGTQGTTGTQGATGIQGSGGTQGATGAGTQGTTGTQGTQGTTGTFGGSWTRKTGNYTAAPSEQIIADTSGGTWILTLPATPTNGTFISVSDGNNWATNPLTVARNGSTIEGFAEDASLNIQGVLVDFIYDGTTWEVFASVGVQGVQGVQGPSAGPQGTTGAQGTTGTQGVTGTQGTTGTGTQGATGTQGTTGLGGGTLYEDVVNSTRYLVFADSTSGAMTKANVNSNLTVNPSTGSLTATVFNSTSDINKKFNITPIWNPLELVEQLNGVRFNWRDTGNRSAGIIAQDLEKIMPELVDDDKSVNYNGIIGLLVEAIKELNKRTR